MVLHQVVVVGPTWAVDQVVLHQVLVEMVAPLAVVAGRAMVQHQALADPANRSAMAMTRDPHGTAGPAPTVGQAVAAAAQAAAVAGAEAVAA